MLLVLVPLILSSEEIVGLKPPFDHSSDGIGRGKLIRLVE